MVKRRGLTEGVPNFRMALKDTAWLATYDSLMGRHKVALVEGDGRDDCSELIRIGFFADASAVQVLRHTRQSLDKTYRLTESPLLPESEACGSGILGWCC